MRLRLISLMLFLGFSGARAALAADAARAKDLYKKATSHYAVGEYELAGETYQSAYKLKPDPALLFNAAQSFRLAGKVDRSLTLYRNYLRLYPKGESAEDVRAHIAKIEAQLAAEKATHIAPAAAAPPAVAPPPPPSPAQVSAPAAPITLTAATPASDAPARRPVYKKAWFWGTAGAAVLAAVVVTVALGSPGAKPWANLPEVRQTALTIQGARW